MLPKRPAGHGVQDVDGFTEDEYDPAWQFAQPEPLTRCPGGHPDGFSQIKCRCTLQGASLSPTTLVPEASHVWAQSSLLLLSGCPEDHGRVYDPRLSPEDQRQVPSLAWSVRPIQQCRFVAKQS